MNRLNNHEKELAVEIVRRWSRRLPIKEKLPDIINQTYHTLNSLSVDYCIDQDKKFTICLLKNGKSVATGSAKRCTYNGKRMAKDEFNPQIGKDISFCRAIQNYISENTIKI